MMSMVYSILAGREVDSSGEEWRHECECRWLLVNRPTRSEKHRWLFGVPDREMLMTRDPRTGQKMLATDHASRWTEKSSIMKVRGLASADRILADARRLHESTMT